MKSIALLAFTVVIANADPGRSSAYYTLTHETTTSAYGGRSTSADYTLDTSGNPAASVANSADYTHRSGFAGQLVDPASLQLSATPFTLIPEGGTRQINAEILNDDDTIGASVTPAWSIISGPLTSVSSTGLVTAEIVYLNTSATVGADYLGLSGSIDLLVNDSNVDNFGSYAGDGLPDWWQAANFGLDNPDAAPDLDPDGDSQTNFAEYLSLYDPNDPTSRLTSILVSTDTVELSKVLFLRTYTLMRSTNLVDWTPTLVVNPPAGAPTFNVSFTDPSPPTNAERVFYKIDINN